MELLISVTFIIHPCEINVNVSVRTERRPFNSIRRLCLLFYSEKDMLDTICAGIVYFVNFMDYLLDIIGNGDKIHCSSLMVYGQDSTHGDILLCRRTADGAAV